MSQSSNCEQRSAHTSAFYTPLHGVQIGVCAVSNKMSAWSWYINTLWCSRCMFLMCTYNHSLLLVASIITYTCPVMEVSIDNTCIVSIHVFYNYAESCDRVMQLKFVKWKAEKTYNTAFLCRTRASKNAAIVLYSTLYKANRWKLVSTEETHVFHWTLYRTVKIYPSSQLIRVTRRQNSDVISAVLGRY